MRYAPLLGLMFLFGSLSLHAQNDNDKNKWGTISGNLQANANFFIRDSLIGAANTPQYDRQKYGADAWFNLNYSNWGFDFGLRFDLFNNSNLLNPTGSFSGQGIGRWFIRKKIHRLDIMVGYIYDQIGSGIIFRAFEQRPLLIDNALLGLRLMYDIGTDWRVKAFTGVQKRQFDVYRSIIKGGAIDGYISGPEGSRWSLAPGFGISNRTLDDASMNSLVAVINTYPVSDAFVPKYNTYAFALYNTLTAGPFTWYVEGAYKTEDTQFDPFATIDSLNITGKFVQEPGTVLYSALSYAQGGFGITLEGKRTEYFDYRTRPQEELNQGLIHFLPPMTRVNTFRLPARYNAATQVIGELAFQADASYNIQRKWNFNVNVSYIDNLQGEKLYREVYTEFQYKHKRLWQLLWGVQWQDYNQEVYEMKPGVPIVRTIVPFAEFLYKFDRKRAIRLEAQWMNMIQGGTTATPFQQDFGDWLFGQVEFTIAPHWTFTVSDMYNLSAGSSTPENENGEKQLLHYPRFDIFYTYKSNRFSISYIKQVEGVVCTGGICRLEPAFSGVRLTVNSTF